jgi:single-strand DNA-binding protein
VIVVNKVILIGRLVRDPELRYTPSGLPVAQFRIAVDRPKNGNGDTADFIPVVAWRVLAENIAKYLTKGRLVAVEGRLQVRKYQDRDGATRWATEVIATNVQFLPDGKTHAKEAEAVPEVTEVTEENGNTEDVPF